MFCIGKMCSNLRLYKFLCAEWILRAALEAEKPWRNDGVWGLNSTKRNVKKIQEWTGLTSSWEAYFYPSHVFTMLVCKGLQFSWGAGTCTKHILTGFAYLSSPSSSFHLLVLPYCLRYILTFIVWGIPLSGYLHNTEKY